MGVTGSERTRSSSSRMRSSSVLSIVIRLDAEMSLMPPQLQAEVSIGMTDKPFDAHILG